jgi:N-carbamoylputrescine amidase
MKELIVGLVQHAVADSRKQTIARSIAGIRDAAARGAKLAVLQELHCTSYFCQTEDTEVFDQAEPIPGPTTAEFAALAKELGIVLVTSLFERRAAGLYHNTAAVLDADGRIAGIYRKMHIPDDPGYYEKFYFTPGDLGFNPIVTSVGRLGVMVCWDQWYPEGARLMALAGADLLIYPTAIGWDLQDSSDEQQRQRDAWITVQRGHAVANGLPVVAVNRVGVESAPDGSGKQHFWGSSFVAGPQGEILAQAATDQEQTLVVNIDCTRSEQVRRIWPFLRDRRIDAYGDLVKRYRD